MSRLTAILAPLLLACLQAAAGTFSFSGDSMETVIAEGRERTLLTGNAEVVTGENRIRADRMELYGANFRYIRCEGEVAVLNEEKGIELSCRELFYDREDKIIRVSGNVIMLDKKNELVVKGGFLQNWEDREETIVQIGVRVLKTDLVCRAEYARYLREEERLELSGMPLVDWKGDEYRALRISIDLERETIRLEGDIHGKVTAEGDEEAKETEETEETEEAEEAAEADGGESTEKAGPPGASIPGPE
ncbi:MAG: hypothetical protein JW820_09220 [Spirochaetales bacterium]|nr:hypothetical protein [Spirochaetales bacterium]